MPSHEAAICVDLSSIWLALQHMLCHLCASQAFLATFAGGREEERRSGFSLPNRRFGPAASPLPLNGKHDAEAEDDQAKDKHDTNNRSADLNPSACVRGHNCSTMYRVRTHGETQTQAHAVCGWCCIAMARAQVQSKGEGGLGEATIKTIRGKTVCCLSSLANAE